MKKFGIEIRKANTLKGLYQDVDAVLSKCEVSPNEINQSVQIQTCAHSLQKMMKPNSHFSVCTIRECSELCGIVIAKERMNVYRAIHCMSWSEMTPEYRQLITAMVLDDFRPILNPTK